MPEVTIKVGGKEFTLACEDGQEPYLYSAAELLDGEASGLLGQIGRIPAERMLLMAGLMLADKTTAFEERALAAEALVQEREAEIAALRAQPAPAPQRVEVPVIPAALVESMADMAAQAEALAAHVEERLGVGRAR